MRTRKKFKISEHLGKGIEVSYVPSVSSLALDLNELANQNNVNRSRLIRIITAHFKKNPDDLKFIVEHYKPLVS